ncbi:hypothetical protein A3I35_01830 [Candidatus Falkowbacteria bacterium RIFCSPLOWO2_02_FULL_45_15]|uniref:Response regulatory domain-containing protein n=2 Tax=Candidatus Falkowiibacteriota TaxID=1752728 RepID=A0A1F5RME6_9BACT|nr:MAG: hypothetical protein A3D54_00670 [Candidatus Falkowbacteria bacterium RIFCSPHIGHO2_02_FULL_45_15]OGF19300.1 MAG: hypothetical protein A3I35_01830 [Candidatus Falkowbacteria bacterium RIFCSPLOWO2_02_FULL_45_15]
MLVLFIAKKGVSNAMLASVFRYALKCDVISYEANDLGKKLMREKPQIIIVLQEVIWDKIYVQRVYSQLREFFSDSPIIWISGLPVVRAKNFINSLDPRNIEYFFSYYPNGQIFAKIINAIQNIQQKLPSGITA